MNVEGCRHRWCDTYMCVCHEFMDWITIHVWCVCVSTINLCAVKKKLKKVFTVGKMISKMNSGTTIFHLFVRLSIHMFSILLGHSSSSSSSSSSPTAGRFLLFMIGPDNFVGPLSTIVPLFGQGNHLYTMLSRQ